MRKLLRTMAGAALGAALLLPNSGALANEGVVEIDQVRALAGGVTATDVPGSPVTLDTPGSCRLTSDLELAWTPSPGGEAKEAVFRDPVTSRCDPSGLLRSAEVYARPMG